MLPGLIMGAFEFSPEVVRQVTRATYDFRDSTEQWARGVQGALQPALDVGQGTLLSLVALPPGGLAIEHLSSVGASRLHHAVVRLSAWLAPAKLRESFFNGRFLGTSSRTYSEGDFARLEARARGGRTKDAAGFCVSDSADYGFMVVSPLPERLALPAQPSRAVRLIAQHVATGLRLQRAVSSVGLQEPSVEAVFDSRGTVHHAQGMARDRASLERLRSEVARRSGGRRTAELDSDEAWSALVAGRWSLVDRFDTDGRRFVVAYRNPEGIVDPRRLTPREECVVTLASLGRSNKEVGAELLISDSTVASLLASAMKKLGLESRTLLPLFRRDLAAGRAWCVDATDARLVALESRDAPTALSPLTPAERAVARSVLAGLSDKDISRRRGSSRRTVARQVTAVFRKLGVSSRAELASKVAAFVSRDSRRDSPSGIEVSAAMLERRPAESSPTATG